MAFHVVSASDCPIAPALLIFFMVLLYLYLSREGKDIA
jgi:hypothetical protein